MLLGHGRAVQAFRATGREGRIGIALNLYPTEPATDAEADADAARLSDGYTNRWFLDAILRGRYPSDMVELYERLAGPTRFLVEGDMAVIGAPSDLLGVNFYNRRVVSAAPESPMPWTVLDAQPGVPTTDSGWEIVPDRLETLLCQLRTDYGDMPLVITENGGAFDAGPAADGDVHDRGRLELIRDHLAAAHRALAGGVRLEGYFHWSLLDNFEWAEGYAHRFGLVHVDFASQRRTVKDSARFYGRVAASNALELDA
jgi:beta-glucosidase